jgi:hypothetical protein
MRDWNAGAIVMSKPQIDWYCRYSVLKYDCSVIGRAAPGPFGAHSTRIDNTAAASKYEGTVRLAHELFTRLVKRTFPNN